MKSLWKCAKCGTEYALDAGEASGGVVRIINPLGVECEHPSKPTARYFARVVASVRA